MYVLGRLSEGAPPGFAMGQIQAQHACRAYQPPRHRQAPVTVNASGPVGLKHQANIAMTRQDFTRADILSRCLADADGFEAHINAVARVRSPAQR